MEVYNNPEDYLAAARNELDEANRLLSVFDPNHRVEVVLDEEAMNDLGKSLSKQLLKDNFQASVTIKNNVFFAVQYAIKAAIKALASSVEHERLIGYLDVLKPQIPEWEDIVSANMGLHNMRISIPTSLFTGDYGDLEEECNDAIEIASWVIDTIENGISTSIS